MECKYYFKINPQEEYDYEQIVNLILQEGNFPEDISDILFSENQNRRDSIIEKLNKIKYDYKEKTIGSDKERLQEAILSGFDFEYGDSKTLTIQLFLSSDKCTIGENKERLYTPVDIEALKQNLIKRYIDNGLTEQQAQLKVANQIEHYSTIESDARLVHELISFRDLSGKAVGSFYNLFLDSSTDDLKVRISRSVIENFYNQLSDKFWKGVVLTDFSGNLKDSIKKGFNIESDLVFDGGEKQRLSGHIDYLIVDKNGYLSLYNFVTSSKEKWTRDKEEFYKLKLLTLKRMLQNNGINVDGIRLYNIPIYISYDDNNEVINDISVGTEKQIYIDYKRGSYLLDKDYQLSKFIKSSINFKFSTNDKITDKLRGAFTSILPPDINLDVDGLHKSVREWIKYAPQEDEAQSQLVIKYIGEPNRQYEVYINGKKVADIKSNVRRENNEEIINVVLDHLNELYDNTGSIANDMYSAIYSAYTNGQVKKLPVVCEHLAEYIYDRDEDGKPKWELIDDLIQYHILLFKKGDNVDVVYLGTSFLNQEIDFKNNQHNILGYVKPDIESIALRGTHGNLYAITSLLILNEYLPNLNLEEFKLGKLKVVSSQGTSLTQYQYNVQHIIKKYFNEIIKEINRRDSNLEIKNNFILAKFADPIPSIIEQLNVVLNDSGIKTEKDNALKSGEWDKALSEALTNKSKELQLKRLLDFITNTFFDDAHYFTPTKILELSNDSSKPLHNIALLYKIVSDAYLLYSNLSLEYDPVLDKMQSFTMKPAYISSRNARLIVNNYRAMLNAMSDDINDGYDEYIHNPVMDYYNAIGYTALRNSTIGMQSKVYQNMFETQDGKLTMYFKNPYSEASNLTEAERKFLKRAIFLFNKFLRPDFAFKDENDLTFIDKVNKDKSFLQVPLQKASSDTEFLTHLGNKIERVKEYIKNRKNILDELYYRIDDTVRKAKNIDLLDDANVFSNLHVGNKFLLNEETRDRYIREKGPEYFETNIEDLLVDVLGEVVEVEKTNSFLVSTKAILLQLEIMKDDYSESSDVIKKELEYISDYLKVNVFKKPLSKGSAEKLLAFMMPLRKFVVDVNLAGNLVGFFRDLENGFIENYWRTASHYLTDITRSDLTKAYVKFFGEAAFNNPMRVNLLNKLCTVYRISNVDLARITERLKTGRAGLSNYENWLYSTLRAPDFLHRMALFMAKCMHDGVIDEDDSKSAFYIKDNRLKYDWKKDKRFEHLAKGDKSDPLYDKELGTYTTLIDTFNSEHPDRKPIQYYQENGELSDLPSPYTEGEIQSIKEVGSNIFGDYDRSNKALGEFHMLGLIFAMYTTWMNGIIANMAMKPGQYSPNPRIWTHAEDAEGKLYRDPNNLLNFIHESDLKEGDRRIPVYEEEITMAQGLLPTLNSLYYHLKDGGIPAAMDYLKANPNVKALMKKELIDLLMTGLWLLLYKLIFDPEYKDRKKQAEGQLILSNFITEVIYKSTRASFDTFKGPWNIVQYLGDLMNPPVWQVPTTLIGDTYRMLLGDKTFYLVLTGNFGFARAFRDTYSMYKRDVLL